ncbi:MAG: TRAP transporter large permease [Peptococcaceae bacterium]|nr:TRAP transporter large permease [Peptococcaceae bacterium]
MSLFAIGMMGVVLCFTLIFLRVPIYLAFAVVGFLGLWVVRGLPAAFNTIGSVPYASASMYVWSVVPLFVFMGFLVMHSNMAQEFYGGIRKWIGHVRGGLAYATIFGNAAFGTCTGVPIGAAVTFTSMSLPEMRKYKYDDKLTLGAISAGGLLSNLIPPSLGFIIYGALTETSIGQLFIAGIIPGLLLTALYCLTIYILCLRNPKLGPPGPHATWKERWSAGVSMWTLVVIMVVILGGIFAGVFTPTEAGAAGAGIVLILALGRRRLSWQGFKTALLETGETTGMVGLLLVGTLVFNTFLVVTKVPATLAAGIAGLTSSYYDTLAIMVIAIIILGMFFDALALALIMIPILYPVAVQVGIDPIHFGVIIGVVMGMGTLTPPFGIVVYAVAGVARDVPLFDIFRGVGPFIIANIVCLILVILFPALSTFLPSLVIQR